MPLAWLGPARSTKTRRPRQRQQSPPPFLPGALRHASGNLVMAGHLSLRLYGVVTGGSPLYTEDLANVNVRSGLFSLIVGDAEVLPASVFNTFPLYIGIKVNNDAEMLPRQRMHRCRLPCKPPAPRML